jgi:hypothetical protein
MKTEQKCDEKKRWRKENDLKKGFLVKEIEGEIENRKVWYFEEKELREWDRKYELLCERDSVL